LDLKFDSPCPSLGPPCCQSPCQFPQPLVP
jgi:hypothetical protein